MGLIIENEKIKNKKAINAVLNVVDSQVQVLGISDDLITDEHQRNYCNQVEKVIIRNEKGIFGGFESCMRSGKTHMAINHHIPFLLKITDLKLVFITAPLSGIVDDNLVKLRSMCAEHGFMFAEHPSDVWDFIEEIPNKKIVLYMTNAMAWVQPGTKAMFEHIGYDNIGCFVDEAQVWTLDHWMNSKDVNGWNASPTYKSVLYKTIKSIILGSGHTYAMSATPNPQFLGQIRTIDGEITYKVVISAPPAKNISHRIGWIGDAYFHSNGSSLVGYNSEEAFQMMLDSMMMIENETGFKRAAMIECNRKSPHDEDPKDFPISVMKSWVMKSNYTLPNLTDDDFIGALMISDNKNIKTHLYSKSGLEDGVVNAKIIYRKLADQEDPLRFLLVIDMAKMGVTLPTVKELFSVRETDLDDKKGVPVTHQARQKLGRPATPYCGAPLTVFYGQFGGHLGNVKNLNPLTNTYNWYLVDNPMNRTAVEEMKEFYPTFQDYQTLNDNYCPSCGRTCNCPSKYNQELDHELDQEIAKKIEDFVS